MRQTATYVDRLTSIFQVLSDIFEPLYRDDSTITYRFVAAFD